MLLIFLLRKRQDEILQMLQTVLDLSRIRLTSGRPTSRTTPDKSTRACLATFPAICARVRPTAFQPGDGEFVSVTIDAGALLTFGFGMPCMTTGPGFSSSPCPRWILESECQTFYCGLCPCGSFDKDHEDGQVG